MQKRGSKGTPKNKKKTVAAAAVQGTFRPFRSKSQGIDLVSFLNHLEKAGLPVTESRTGKAGNPPLASLLHPEVIATWDEKTEARAFTLEDDWHPILLLVELPGDRNVALAMMETDKASDLARNSQALLLDGLDEAAATLEQKAVKAERAQRRKLEREAPETPKSTPNRKTRREGARSEGKTDAKITPGRNGTFTETQFSLATGLNKSQMGQVVKEMEQQGKQGGRRKNDQHILSHGGGRLCVFKTTARLVCNGGSLEERLHLVVHWARCQIELFGFRLETRRNWNELLLESGSDFSIPDTPTETVRRTRSMSSAATADDERPPPLAVEAASGAALRLPPLGLARARSSSHEGSPLRSSSRSQSSSRSYASTALLSRTSSSRSPSSNPSRTQSLPRFPSLSSPPQTPPQRRPMPSMSNNEDTDLGDMEVLQDRKPRQPPSAEGPKRAVFHVPATDSKNNPGVSYMEEDDEIRLRLCVGDQSDPNKFGEPGALLENPNKDSTVEAVNQLAFAKNALFNQQVTLKDPTGATASILGGLRAMERLNLSLVDLVSHTFAMAITGDAVFAASGWLNGKIDTQVGALKKEILKNRKEIEGLRRELSATQEPAALLAKELADLRSQVERNQKEIEALRMRRQPQETKVQSSGGEARPGTNTIANGATPDFVLPMPPSLAHPKPSLTFGAGGQPAGGKPLGTGTPPGLPAMPPLPGVDSPKDKGDSQQKQLAAEHPYRRSSQKEKAAHAKAFAVGKEDVVTQVLDLNGIPLHLMQTTGGKPPKSRPPMVHEGFPDLVAQINAQLDHTCGYKLADTQVVAQSPFRSGDLAYSFAKLVVEGCSYKKPVPETISYKIVNLMDNLGHGHAQEPADTPGTTSSRAERDAFRSSKTGKAFEEEKSSQLETFRGQIVRLLVSLKDSMDGGWPDDTFIKKLQGRKVSTTHGSHKRTGSGSRNDRDRREPKKARTSHNDRGGNAPRERPRRR